jgi:type IV pilus assembly protein PilO
VAALPRIVTVHDVNINPVDKDKSGAMLMKAAIKTYNENVNQESSTGKVKKRRGKR